MRAAPNPSVKQSVQKRYKLCYPQIKTSVEIIWWLVVGDICLWVAQRKVEAIGLRTSTVAMLAETLVIIRQCAAGVRQFTNL